MPPRHCQAVHQALVAGRSFARGEDVISIFWAKGGGAAPLATACLWPHLVKVAQGAWPLQCCRPFRRLGKIREAGKAHVGHGDCHLQGADPLYAVGWVLCVVNGGAPAAVRCSGWGGTIKTVHGDDASTRTAFRLKNDAATAAEGDLEGGHGLCERHDARALQRERTLHRFA